MEFDELEAIPWLLPGLGLSLVAGMLLRGSVGRAFGAGPRLGLALVVSLGLILSATLTPSREAMDLGTAGVQGCDLSRIGPPSLDRLLHHDETVLNIFLFLPLGLVLALLPPSDRKRAAIVGAFALPFVVEAIQALVPWLDRACESADVVDNLTGLLVGLVLGALSLRFTGEEARGR